MKYVVRPKLSGHDKQFSGSEGATGTMVYAESAAKAREIGAQKLGKTQAQVEVIEHEESPNVVGGNEPLTEEEAREIFNQGSSVVPGSWESV